jgi:DNA processing protein
MTEQKKTGQLSETDILAYIRLSRTEKPGPLTFRGLMNLYGEPHAALSALPELAARGGRSKAFKPALEQAAKREYETTLKLGGTFLVLGTAPYPELLAQTPDAPPVMWCYGHAHLLSKPALAMVGARNASASGQGIAGKLAKDIGARGLILVSGLARGIDRAAHQSALEAGTIAVIANGIDHSYPRENGELQQQIYEQGLILCENPPGTAPQASQFPRRNRIISGLSLGVVVVEAARRSGLLITARLAGEYGHEVMAVPGSPLDPRCNGSNHLIRTGAAVIETVDDIMEALRPLIENMALKTPDQKTPKRRPSQPAPISDAMRGKITALLGPVPIRIDDLVEQAEAPLQSLHLVLLELELAGRLTYDSGGQVCLDIND